MKEALLNPTLQAYFTANYPNCKWLVEHDKMLDAILIGCYPKGRLMFSMKRIQGIEVEKVLQLDDDGIQAWADAHAAELIDSAMGVL